MIDAVAACEAIECDDGHELGPSTLLQSTFHTLSLPTNNFVASQIATVSFAALKNELYEESLCDASHLLDFFLSIIP